MIAIAAAALLGSATLDPVFDKLAARDRVHILQIGDSHSAGDAITGGWREILQARYGGAGRGVLPPGRPYDGYLTRGVRVSMSPGWRVAADFGTNWGGGGTPLGLSAFTLTSQVDGATMAIEAEAGQAFDRFVVCGMAKAGAGSVVMRAGVDSVRFPLNAPTERPECRTVTLAQPTTGADLRIEGGPVTLTSWATFKSGPGVVLSNLGVVGSQLVHFARTDDRVIAEELRAYRPDLIVIAFGTNEGFSPRFNAFEYEVTLRTQIGRMRRLAGNVPILLFGAPDALSRREAMRGNADGGSVNCGVAVAPAPAEQPGVIASIVARLRDGVGMAQESPPAATPARPAALGSGLSSGALFPPAALAQVRAVQRRVAAQLNVAFWDWEAAMGGRCAADAWVHANPPLMRGDYVHFTSAGGRELARRLQADLDRAMAAGR
jgi:lysophospholipase L1-like esterase